MDAIKVQLTTCNSELDKCLGDPKKPWAKYLAMAEEKTNVPRKYIFLGEYSGALIRTTLIVDLKCNFS